MDRVQQALIDIVISFVHLPNFPDPTLKNASYKKPLSPRVTLVSPFLLPTASAAPSVPFLSPFVYKAFAVAKAYLQFFKFYFPIVLW